MHFMLSYGFSHLPLFFAAGHRARGNWGGHASFATLKPLASLFVILRASRSASDKATILHPIVLNNSVALLVS